MDIKEYISSGIIESYVMGLATAEERAEFEELCRRFPELVAARNAFELELEKQAQALGVKPASTVKEKLMSVIRKESSSRTPVVRMEKRRSNSSVLRWIAAASVILMLSAGYLAFDFYMQKKDMQRELARIEKEMKEMEPVSNPNAMVVNLRGTDKAPKSAASIYWDSTSTDVFLLVKNMPLLPSDKQYQLWALIGNQPKDLGLFDVDEDGKVMLKMVNTQKADAFAITIEKRGNKNGPDMDAVQVVGNTNL